MPNVTASPFIITNRIKMENEEFKQSIVGRIPLGRIADPKDIVGATIFFSAPASSFITGQIVYLNGGITTSHVSSGMSGGWVQHCAHPPF